MNELEKKVVEVKNDDAYKALSQMSVDELNKLIPLKYSIYAQERKKQKGMFAYSAHCEIKPGLGFDFYLEEAEFYLIQSEKNCKPGYNSYSFLRGSCRILKGKRKNDASIFYAIEVALTPKIFRSKYLSESQVRLLESAYPNLPVVDRTNIQGKEFVPFDGSQQVD